MNPLLEAVIGILLVAALQAAMGLAPLLLLGLAMQGLSVVIQRATSGLLGFKAGYLLFGWLGTVIHELGHVVFHLLFGHRVLEVKWTDMEAHDGMHGYVMASYDTGSLYHRVGLFFVAVGPLLLGALAVFLSAYFLLGLEPHDVSNLPLPEADSATLSAGLSTLFGGFIDGFTRIAGHLLASENLTRWQFYLFLYLTFSIAGGLRLSGEDLRTGLEGVGWFLLVVFGLNLLWMVFGGLTGHWVDLPGRVLGMLYSTLLFALCAYAGMAAILLTALITARAVRRSTGY